MQSCVSDCIKPDPEWHDGYLIVLLSLCILSPFLDMHGYCRVHRSTELYFEQNRLSLEKKKRKLCCDLHGGAFTSRLSTIKRLFFQIQNLTYSVRGLNHFLPSKTLFASMLPVLEEPLIGFKGYTEGKLVPGKMAIQKLSEISRS